VKRGGWGVEYWKTGVWTGRAERATNTRAPNLSTGYPGRVIHRISTTNCNELLTLDIVGKVIHIVAIIQQDNDIKL